MVSFYPLGADDRGFFTLGSKLALIAVVTFTTHILVSALFDLEEVRPIFSYIRKIILKPINIQF
jgi:hypothetical protein